MRQSKRYRTSLGKPAVYLLMGQVAVVLGALAFWRVGAWPLMALCAVVLCLAAWIMFGTRYVIGDGFLDARRGPFRTRVPLRDITAVNRRAVDRGTTFGLGSHFIGIEFGLNGLNVSPRDADDFIAAVRAVMANASPSKQTQATQG